MIKIFDANDRNFSSAGNIIIEPIKCNEVKRKSLNGWYIEVEVPIKYNDYIAKDKLCVVKTKSKLNPQAFRIGESIERSTRIIKFKADHVMFDAKDYVLLDVRPTNLNGLNALNYINNRTDETSPFLMYSNVEHTDTAYFIRKNLLEAWAVIEERWGGFFDADNWDISFLSSVGHDNGETIVYGKNLQGFDNYEDWSAVCTKIYPVGYDGIMLPEKYIEADVQYEKPYTRVVDFETKLEPEDQTEANLITELRANANAYIEENKVPKVSYTIISNINGDLEIGDTVKVLHPFVNIFTEVLEYEYNLISKKVVSLTFGNYSRSVKAKFDNIKKSIEQINEVVSKQEVTINNQTNIINSLNKNGYVYIDDNEILILDALPKESAHNVWRFGLGGIGFSSNGYEGPFEIAMTMDGQINANFITTGTLNVARIEGLSSFMTDTASSIETIEINQGNITARVETAETNIESVQGQVQTITDTTGTGTGKFIHLEDCSDQPFNSIVMNGETSQVTSTQNSNLFDEKYYNNDSLYTSGTYKYTKARFKGNRTLYFKASLKEGKTAQEGAYIAISESAGSPYGSGTKSLYAIRNGAVQTTTSFDFTGVTDLYVNIYPNDLTCSTIFNNYNLWVSTNNVDYAPFVPDMPSPDYPSEIKNADGKNKFSGWVKGVGLNGTTGEETTWSSAASSGYIPVNFNSSPNYYLSGLTDTLTHWIGAYNAQKQFLGRTVGTHSKTRGLNANSFTSGTPQGTGDIAYLRAIQYVGSGDTATIDAVDNLQTQLEEGQALTFYEPYNSLAVRVDNKNLIEAHDYTNEITDTRTSLSLWIFLGDTSWAQQSKIVGTPITATGVKSWTFTPSKNYSLVRIKHSGLEHDLIQDCKCVLSAGNTYTISLSITGLDVTTVGGFTYKDVQVEVSSSRTDYISNEHQTAYFPLQGEKLMQGDYIDSQGIHHKRARITLNGTETWSNQSGAYDTTTRIMFSHYDSRIKNNLANRKGVCDYFVNYSTTVQSPNVDVTAFNFHQSAQYSNYLYFKIEKDKLPTADVAGWKAWLAEHPITVEYELAEYELTPFTTDQQAAWDEISLLTTYKRITNISSDASLNIEYLKDNGLDVYETRSSAEVTKSQVQRLTIEEGRIASEVSSTKSSLTNYYTKDEADGNMQSTSDELKNIISQNKTEAEQTAEQIALRVSSIETNGSTRVETTTGYTFDDEGLKIDKTGAVTSSVIDNEAFKVTEKSTDEEVFFAGYVSDQSSEYRGQTIVKSTNLVVKNYLNIEGASRFQPYTNPVLGGHGTGAFDIG